MQQGSPSSPLSSLHSSRSPSPEAVDSNPTSISVVSPKFSSHELVTNRLEHKGMQLRELEKSTFPLLNEDQMKSYQNMERHYDVWKPVSYMGLLILLRAENEGIVEINRSSMETSKHYRIDFNGKSVESFVGIYGVQVLDAKEFYERYEKEWAPKYAKENWRRAGFHVKNLGSNRKHLSFDPVTLGTYMFQQQSKNKNRKPITIYEDGVVIPILSKASIKVQTAAAIAESRSLPGVLPQTASSRPLGQVHAPIIRQSQFSAFSAPRAASAISMLDTLANVASTSPRMNTINMTLKAD